MTIQAEIMNDVTAVSYESYGCKRTKQITTEDFAKAILSSNPNSKKCTISPLGLRIHAESGDKVIVGYELPERVAKLPFRRDSSKFVINSVLPWGMTFISFTKVHEGLQWNSFYQFALTGPIVSKDTQMFVWPGSNVYESYNCCIGKIDVPKLSGIEQTGGLPYIFYNGVSNGDLSGNRFIKFSDDKGKYIEYPFDLFNYLAVKDGDTVKPFPYEILKPATTVGSFLSSGGYL